MASMFSWLAVPLDHLWLQLQYFDQRSSLILDLQDVRTNPFEFCYKEVSLAMTKPASEGPLKVVYKHYGLDGEEEEWFSELVQTVAGGMLSQLHSRFRIKFSGWPWRLARLVDAKASAKEKNLLAADFWAEPACCLDDEFSAKLRCLCSSQQCLVTDGTIQSSLRLWAQHTKLTNMHIERLLARMKKSCRERFPSIQKLACTSLLTQWLHRHKEAGGLDPRASQRRAILIEKGVPLRAAKRGTASARRGRTRSGCGGFSYVKKHMSKFKLRRPDRDAERRRLLKEFWTLSEEDRVEYSRRERLQEPPELAGETREEVYKRLVGQKLWGLSDEEQPLRASVFAQALEDIEAGLSARGVRCYLQRLRESFYEDMVVHDEGDIPQKQKVTMRLPCQLAHCGLCPAKHPEMYDDAVEFSDNFDRFAVRTSKAGDYFMLRTEPPTQEWYLMVGSVRYKNPISAVAMMCLRTVDGFLEFETDGDGIIRPAVSSQLAALIFGGGCIDSIIIAKILVQRVVGVFSRASMQQPEAEETVLWGRAGGRLPGAPLAQAAKQPLTAAQAKPNAIEAAFFALPAADTAHRRGPVAQERGVRMLRPRPASKTIDFGEDDGSSDSDSDTSSMTADVEDLCKPPAPLAGKLPAGAPEGAIEGDGGSVARDAATPSAPASRAASSSVALAAPPPEASSVSAPPPPPVPGDGEGGRIGRLATGSTTVLTPFRYIRLETWFSCTAFVFQKCLLGLAVFMS